MDNLKPFQNESFGESEELKYKELAEKIKTEFNLTENEFMQIFYQWASEVVSITKKFVNQLENANKKEKGVD